MLCVELCSNPSACLWLGLLCCLLLPNGMFRARSLQNHRTRWRVWWCRVAGDTLLSLDLILKERIENFQRSSYSCRLSLRASLSIEAATPCWVFFKAVGPFSPPSPSLCRACSDLKSKLLAQDSPHSWTSTSAAQGKGPSLLGLGFRA